MFAMVLQTRLKYKAKTNLPLKVIEIVPWQWKRGTPYTRYTDQKKE